MFRSLSLAAAALAGLAAMATAQQAEPVETPPAQAALPLSEIIRGFEDRGYRLTDIDVDREVIEIEGADASGARIEARVDPATGEVLSEQPDD